MAALEENTALLELDISCVSPICYFFLQKTRNVLPSPLNILVVCFVQNLLKLQLVGPFFFCGGWGRYALGERCKICATLKLWSSRVSGTGQGKTCPGKNSCQEKFWRKNSVPIFFFFFCLGVHRIFSGRSFSLSGSHISPPMYFYLKNKHDDIFNKKEEQIILSIL